MTLVEIACAVASFLLLCGAMILRPTSAECPSGWGLRMGVRSDGHFECWRAPVGDEDWQWSSGRPDQSVQPPGVLRSRIYCTGGATTHQDGAKVWCQR